MHFVGFQGRKQTSKAIKYLKVLKSSFSIWGPPRVEHWPFCKSLLLYTIMCVRRYFSSVFPRYASVAIPRFRNPNKASTGSGERNKDIETPRYSPLAESQVSRHLTVSSLLSVLSKGLCCYWLCCLRGYQIQKDDLRSPG